MYTKINNEYITVMISETGAELQSIFCDNKEFFWQGDKKIWERRSPILFPIVGRLKNDELKFDGDIYNLNKHGFAQDAEFELVEKTDIKAVYKLTSNEALIKSYPFLFKLYVEYELSEKKLAVRYRVCNKDNKDIYFSIGGHPGFNCDMGDRLVFNKKETLERYLMNDDSYIYDKISFLENSDEIVISEELFKNDALIFKNPKSDSITLKTKKGDITVEFGDVPYLGIWAKPGAHYVCIEPWFGIDDHIDANCSFDKKEGIIKLEENKEFMYSFSIIINN